MNFELSEEDKKALLAQAREIITAALEKRRPEIIQAVEGGLAKPCGAFVTLHLTDSKESDESEGKGRKLRGCIGRMTSPTPLIQTVRDMAFQSAFEDPRFPPLGAEELDRISIEISAISPMEICADPHSVKVGVHGLYIRHLGRQGVLLPQVPVEQGWNRQEYLDYICLKAGLPPRSYEAEDAELLTFTAIVFEE